MSDHLFPESTTYVHSYKPHEILTRREQHVSAEASAVEYLPLPLAKKTPPKSETKTKFEEEMDFNGAYGYWLKPMVLSVGRLNPSNHHFLLYCILPNYGNSNYESITNRVAVEPLKETLGKKTYGVVATTGNVDMNDLTPEEKTFFISQTYRTTYDDYAKTTSTSSGVHMKKPFGRLDDQMLLVLNATKPDLSYYGFGLPNKCCVAWGTAQLRTLPSEERRHVVDRRKLSNPFPGYPEKMYPHIETGELSPHYDGSFPFGYTGHQRHFLEYPEDVNKLLRRDFPKHVPRCMTTNQAKLIYKSIPECEKREEMVKEFDNK